MLSLQRDISSPKPLAMWPRGLRALQMINLAPSLSLPAHPPASAPAPFIPPFPSLCPASRILEEASCQSRPGKEGQPIPSITETLSSGFASQRVGVGAQIVGVHGPSPHLSSSCYAGPRIHLAPPLFPRLQNGFEKKESAL